MKYLINNILNFFQIFIIFRDGFALGEQLYMSSLVNKIKMKETNVKIILLTTCPDLYYHNPLIFKLINIKNNNFFKKIFIVFLKITQGSNIIMFYPYNYKNHNDKNYLSKYKKDLHVIKINSERSNVFYNKEDIKNFFYFSKREEENLKKKFNYLKNFNLIQSETKKNFTKNKNWETNNFQEVVDHFSNNQWVQIGLSSDKKIENILNLNGKTTIRELAYLVKNAKLIVCLEGFIAHLSSCFNTKTFVIYSGIVPIENLIYGNIIPISKSEDLDCSPCYLFTDCNKSEKYCTSRITSSDVINVINSR